ncbi:hypothetical protein HPB48_026376 [Haemaphysalis longicornis]|uniref:Tick transposon n=1 Tax=Haemaphysalis longicornis TaxID=44386 RepID=A0A9J6HBQ7_HAELO|nr:hypothetical protein HPB48_026376 [Haemaphysalis longicornis]
MPADKDGGFLVLPSETRGSEAILSHFKKCNEVDLKGLGLRVKNSKKSCLEMFFAGKTHKVDCPLRVIISERGTWQKTMGLFIQQKLKLLTIEDLFLVRNSNEVGVFFQLK